MPIILTLIAAGLGALAIPVWTALLARKKNRSAKKWFTLSCLAAMLVPIVGSLIVLVILLTLKPDSQTETVQKQLFSNQAMVAIGSTLSVALLIGMAGIVPAVNTILNALTL